MIHHHHHLFIAAFLTIVAVAAIVVSKHHLQKNAGYPPFQSQGNSGTFSVYP